MGAAVRRHSRRRDLARDEGLDDIEPWLALLGTLGTAAFALFRQNLPRALPHVADLVIGPLESALGKVHSGIVNDYVVWIALGLALLAGSAAV